MTYLLSHYPVTMFLLLWALALFVIAFWVEMFWHSCRNIWRYVRRDLRPFDEDRK